MSPSRKQLERLLSLVSATRAEEIDCDEFLARVGAYLERLNTSALDQQDVMEVRQHLEVCPECREEFEALLQVHNAENQEPPVSNDQ